MVESEIAEEVEPAPRLTQAGKDLVRECNALKIMLDLSHLNEAGFWDVARISVRPLVATHSAAHAICPHARNLTDRQLDAIAESDGMVGLNFGCAFLRADGRLDPSSLPFSDGPDTSVRGYVRPLAGERVDAAWLAMICDWFPPPAFVNVMPPAGGISVDMLTHIHRPSPPTGDDGWLGGWFEIETSHDGLATERGRIVTPDGLAVADSIQTRWTAARG